MARLHAKSATIYVDEFDFSGVSNSVELEVQGKLDPVTAFADTDATYLEGKPGCTVTVNGFYSTASPDYDGEMFTDLTAADRRIGVYPGGRTAGNFGYEAVVNIAREPITQAPGTAVLLNVSWQGDTPLFRAQILHTNTAFGGSADGTAYQFGAASASQTVVGVLRLLAAPSGAGNNTMAVKIQSDNAANMASPTDQLTFAQLNQASVALHEVVTAAGAITDDWWRVVLTYAGAGTRTFNILVTFGIRPT